METGSATAGAARPIDMTAPTAPTRSFAITINLCSLFVYLNNYCSSYQVHVNLRLAVGSVRCFCTLCAEVYDGSTARRDHIHGARHGNRRGRPGHPRRPTRGLPRLKEAHGRKNASAKAPARKRRIRYAALLRRSQSNSADAAISRGPTARESSTAQQCGAQHRWLGQ